MGLIGFLSLLDVTRYFCVPESKIAPDICHYPIDSRPDDNGMPAFWSLSAPTSIPIHKLHQAFKTRVPAGQSQDVNFSRFRALPAPLFLQG